MTDPSHRLRRDKRALRREILARRDALPIVARAANSQAIADRLLGLAEVLGATRAMAFWSFGSEVDTSAVIERLTARGTIVAVPRIHGDELEAVEPSPDAPLDVTGFGTMEPMSGRVLDPASLDLVVVPGVAFDRSCRRVGYGRGYYDRFLVRTRPGTPAVAVAFALQLVHEVPSGPGDRTVDAVVTEDETIRCP